jgi:hypothetical protein
MPRSQYCWFYPCNHKTCATTSSIIANLAQCLYIY